jgi:hypothetical protein
MLKINYYDMKIIKFKLFENTSKITQGNINGMNDVKSPQPKQKGEFLCDLPSKKNEKNEIINEKLIIFNDFFNKKNEITNENLMTFDEFHLNEEGGVATATLGNTSGMGAVVAPTVSAIPGDVSGSISGSGDLPAYDKNISKIINIKSKKKKKKISKTTKENYQPLSFNQVIND